MNTADNVWASAVFWTAAAVFASLIYAALTFLHELLRREKQQRRERRSYLDAHVHAALDGRVPEQRQEVKQR
ncbi:MAG TPA: hypothetical protein VFB19_18730 [Mycobacterium sp.]|nr:hypothetical protein [Mycobacterium sp.]